MTVVFATLTAVLVIAALVILAMVLTDRKSSAELGRARSDASDVNSGGECNVHVGLSDGGGAD